VAFSVLDRFAMKRPNKLQVKLENVRVLSSTELEMVGGGSYALAVSGVQCNQVNTAGAATSGTITSDYTANLYIIP
jgi:hypothetical protein